MNKTIYIVSLALVAAFALGTDTAQSQSGRSGYGYGMGPGMMGGWIEVPDKLPAPKSKVWVEKLKEILTLEDQSLAQYLADQEKYNAYMPYMRVIPQEENHIASIRQLFTAYGLTAEGKTGQVIDNKTLTQSYEQSVRLESALLPRYEWLVKEAEDRDTAQVLNAILIQSRWHMVMFEHALRMGHGYGYSRGYGMMSGSGYGRGQGEMGGSGYGSGQGTMGGAGYGMGPGMMGRNGLGSGMGSGYGQPSHRTGKPLDAKEAEAMMNDYLKSTRNPNLKLGKVKEVDGAFEAEIWTKNNDLVDRVLIDKDSGFVRSTY